MKQVRNIFRHQVKGFFVDKGMLIFYGISILFIGTVLPYIWKSFSSYVSTLYFFTLIFTRPLLSDSIALEREKKTLEPLLATRISVGAISIGKGAFIFTFCSLYFLSSLLLTKVASLFYEFDWSFHTTDLCLILISVLLSFLSFIFLGIYRSIKSKNTHSANSKLGIPLILYNLLFIIAISVMKELPNVYGFIAPVVLSTLHLILIFIYLIKECAMPKCKYYEEGNAIVKNNIGMVAIRQSKRSVGHFTAIVRHEFKYLLTLRTLLLNFLLLSFAPAIVICLMRYYTGAFDLRYALLILTLAIPRIPTNLVAYSIGGEKVYKTGESLLATPLKSRTILLGKSIVPIIVSFIVLVLATNFSLLSMTLYSKLTNSFDVLPKLTLEYILLFYVTSFLSSVLMIMITGLLCLYLKTPRQGLYVTSLLGPVFLIPITLLIYLVPNLLLGTILYIILLFAAILVILFLIGAHLNRPYMLSRI